MFDDWTSTDFMIALWMTVLVVLIAIGVFSGAFDNAWRLFFG